MSKITGATLIARSLKQQGIDHLFGVVGFPVGPIAAAAQEEGINYVGMRNEQAASYAAQAYGYMTGRPGACITVTGPGVVHGLAGLAGLPRLGQVAARGQDGGGAGLVPRLGAVVGSDALAAGGLYDYAPSRLCALGGCGQCQTSAYLRRAGARSDGDAVDDDTLYADRVDGCLRSGDVCSLYHHP